MPIPRPLPQSLQSESLGVGPGFVFFKASQGVEAHSQAGSPVSHGLQQPLMSTHTAPSYSHRPGSAPARRCTSVCSAWDALLRGRHDGSLTPHSTQISIQAGISSARPTRTSPHVKGQLPLLPPVPAFSSSEHLPPPNRLLTRLFFVSCLNVNPSRPGALSISGSAVSSGPTTVPGTQYLVLFSKYVLGG